MFQPEKRYQYEWTLEERISLWRGLCVFLSACCLFLFVVHHTPYCLLVLIALTFLITVIQSHVSTSEDPALRSRPLWSAISGDATAPYHKPVTYGNNAHPTASTDSFVKLAIAASELYHNAKQTALEWLFGDSAAVGRKLPDIRPHPSSVYHRAGTLGPEQGGSKIHRRGFISPERYSSMYESRQRAEREGRQLAECGQFSSLGLNGRSRAGAFGGSTLISSSRSQLEPRMELASARTVGSSRYYSRVMPSVVSASMNAPHTTTATAGEANVIRRFIEEQSPMDFVTSSSGGQEIGPGSKGSGGDIVPFRGTGRSLPRLLPYVDGGGDPGLRQRMTRFYSENQATDNRVTYASSARAGAVRQQKFGIGEPCDVRTANNQVSSSLARPPLSAIGDDIGGIATRTQSSSSYQVQSSTAAWIGKSSKDNRMRPLWTDTPVAGGHPSVGSTSPEDKLSASSGGAVDSAGSDVDVVVSPIPGAPFSERRYGLLTRDAVPAYQPQKPLSPSYALSPGKTSTPIETYKRQILSH